MKILRHMIYDLIGSKPNFFSYFILVFSLIKEINIFYLSLQTNIGHIQLEKSYVSFTFLFSTFHLFKQYVYFMIINVFKNKTVGTLNLLVKIFYNSVLSLQFLADGWQWRQLYISIRSGSYRIYNR